MPTWMEPLLEFLGPDLLLWLFAAIVSGVALIAALVLGLIVLASWRPRRKPARPNGLRKLPRAGNRLFRPRCSCL